ncbi:zinc finger CCCH domain-containing protein 19 [Tanacetum coccineum]|uniref:Zinc finger CCCH domain-containing protein 19 n=1 Tax=Tanacetum coccineum TaxID=301880 RepID=A0ABQ5J2X8_9ASTR
MAIGTGHRSNNYSESKGNDHLDNNRRQEQRNKAVLANKSVDMLGKYGTSNAGAEILWVSDCNTVVEFDSMDKKVGKRQDFKGVKRDIFEVQRCFSRFDTNERCVWIDLVVVCPLASWAPEVYKSWWSGGSSVFYGYVCILAHPILNTTRVKFASNPLERKDAEGPSLDESLENEEHLDVDSCDSDSPKNVNNDSVSPSSRFWRRGRMFGWKIDEIDSDKRWSYRDPNGNIHGLFSLAQLRSWKDYFPSDLQIWSYYGNVKEAILLHNALSRQTKDAG